MDLLQEALTVSQAARFLGRSEAAIRQALQRRQLPFRKNGRRVLLLRSELQRYLDALPGLRPEEVEPSRRRLKELEGA